MSSEPKFRAHDWQWVGKDESRQLRPCIRIFPPAPPEERYTKRVKEPATPIVSAAEISRRQETAAKQSGARQAIEPEPAHAPAAWPPIPKHIQPYVDALFELRERLEAQRADWRGRLKPTKHREETFDAVGSDGGNFELRAWASIADGRDVQHALDEREKVLRTWIAGTERIHPDTRPHQIAKLNHFREALYTIKKPHSKKPPTSAASLPDGEEVRTA